MTPSQFEQVSLPISGEQLYQQRARAALPLLVRQAEAGQTVLYSNLAAELGMPNPRNLNYVLGAVGTVMENLSKAWKTKVPPIQCLVVNKSTGIPGEGIGWFLIEKSDFKNLSRAKQREIVKAELTHVFAFARWREILKLLHLNAVSTDCNELIRQAAIFGQGGGESDAHRRLKEYIAAHPICVGLAQSTPHGLTEEKLPSGDCLDVSFRDSSEWVAIEVKPRNSPEADIVRGLYQCVKYEAVMQAVESAEARERTGRAILALEGHFPESLIGLRNILGVSVLENVGPPT